MVIWCCIAATCRIHLYQSIVMQYCILVLLSVKCGASLAPHWHITLSHLSVFLLTILSLRSLPTLIIGRGSNKYRGPKQLGTFLLNVLKYQLLWDIDSLKWLIWMRPAKKNHLLLLSFSSWKGALKFQFLLLKFQKSEVILSPCS